MDWIQTHIAKLFEGMFWSTLISHLQWVDWFTFGFIILGMAYGSKKGLMRELVELLELVFLIFLVFTYQKVTLAFFKNVMPSFTNRMLEPVVIISLGLIFWFLILFVDRFLQKAIHAKVASVLKVIGGIIVGVVHFVVFWSLISHILIALPIGKMAQAYESGGSVTGEKVKNIAPAIYQFIANPSEYYKEVKA
jgi:uncharacterized membrane protein required for colicin V production